MASANIGTIRGKQQSRRLRRRVPHALINMRLELGEVVDEQLDQLARYRVVGVLVGPGRARVENGRIDALDRDRHVEAEVRVLAEFGAVERAVERGVEQRAGGLDR